MGYINDDTVEGACVLMNKVGYLIDEKIKKIESKKSGENDHDGGKNAQKYIAIFKRFDELAENDPNNICSLRVRMIIKNL